MDDGNAERDFERPLAELERDADAPSTDDTWSWLSSARAAVDEFGGATEAGWHRDPARLHAARYWDGTRWTDRVIDRNRALSTHIVGLEYPQPGIELEPAAPTASSRPVLADEVPDDAGSVSDPYALLVMDSLADGNPYAEATIDHAEAVALAASVLQRACERAGFDWRATEMTIDDAIDALPADLAAATVKVMREVYEGAGDDENTAWTAAKLREIQSLERAHRKLQSLVNSRFRDEFIAKAGDSGVSSELSANFLDRFVTVEMPTLAKLKS